MMNLYYECAKQFEHNAKARTDLTNKSTQKPFIKYTGGIVLLVALYLMYNKSGKKSKPWRGWRRVIRLHAAF